MRVIRSVLALVLSFVSLSCVAQSLWRNSAYGMSIAEVRSIYPEASNPAKPSTLQNGASEQLELPGIQLGKNSFTARFYFKDSRLTQVTLELSNDLSAKDAADAWDELYASEVSKSGKEAHRRESNGKIKGKAATWISNGTEKTFFFMAKEDYRPILNIVYQVQTPD